MQSSEDQTSRSKARRRSVPLQTRLGLAFFLMAFAAAVIMAVALFPVVHRMLKAEVSDDLLKSLRLIALQVDAEAHRRLSVESPASHPEYATLLNSLEASRRAAGRLAFAMTFRRDAAGRFRPIAVSVDEGKGVNARALALEIAAAQGDVVEASHSVLGLEPLKAGGVKWFVDAAPLADRQGGTAGLLVVGIDAGDLLARERRLLGVLSAALLFTAPLALLFGWATSRRLVAPLRALRDGAQRIARGDLAHRVEIRRHDEIHDLADAFNAMSEQLNDSMENARRFQRFAEASAQGFSMAAMDGTIRYANPALAAMVGAKSVENLHEYNLTELYDADDGRRLMTEALPAVLDQGRWIGELGLRSRGGSLLPTIQTVFLVRNERGEPTHIASVIVDIAERKKAEEELSSYREHLEDLVAERTAELTQAKRDAELADQAKSEFLANMSHEIRTPMNGVVGMTGLLLDTPLDAEQREYAETIRSCADSLIALINDILDFSKIEAGRLDLEEMDFDLRATLEDTADVVAVKAHEKDLEFTCTIDAEAPALLQGDPGRLRQVILNLTGNAVKFTESGEVAVEVQVEDECDDVVTLRFSVSDTGIGVSEDQAEILFEAFTQADASITRQYGGTGLGLAISKRLVHLMGGDIGLKSELGKGSVFWFTAVFRKQTVSRSPIEPLDEDMRGKRVLVVDDNATNRRLMRLLLEKWGLERDEASDGAEALEKLRAASAEGRPFDVAVLDMQMPAMSGETLGRKMKADPALAGTRLVMMASLGKRGDAARLRRVGFAAYLTKPVKQGQVRECLATVLRDALPALESTGEIVTRHTLAENRKRRVRILLAEDNIVNQRVALRILEKAGYYADAVANGREAVDALRSRAYDFVLMDVQMPEMDGLAATRMIRDPRSGVLNPAAPVVAMTANAMKGDREACLEAGMDDYISKPVRPKDLVEIVERYVARTADENT